MQVITFSVVLGVVFALVGRTEGLKIPGMRVQHSRNFALRAVTDSTPVTGSACKLPLIEDPTTQSERATKGDNRLKSPSMNKLPSLS